MSLRYRTLAAFGTGMFMLAALIGPVPVAARSLSLPAPTGLSILDVTATQFTIEWDAVLGARGYDIYFAGQYKASTHDLRWTTPPRGGGEYKVQVVATSPTAYSPKSTPVYITLTGGAPAPTPIVAEPAPIITIPPTVGVWKEVFHEDFTTPAALGSFEGTYGSKWKVYPEPWRDTSKSGLYSPKRVLSVADGVLRVNVHSEGGQPLVAAVLPRIPDQTYGKFVVRFRADPVANYKTAWLLWPDSEKWPDDGEIDFPEGSLNKTIKAYSHYASPSGGQDAFSTGVTYADWHTATTEWAPGKVTFLLDGVVVGVSTTKVPNKPMHWVLQTETSLSTKPAPDASGSAYIDWVTAYTYGG